MYQPRFVITPNINNWIAEIERIRTVIARSRILPREEIVLRHRALVDATHSSTSIEGNPLTKGEVEQVIAGKLVRASERAIIEIQNYKKALDWIEKRVGRKTPLSVKDALALHRLAMVNLLPRQKVGVFRFGSVYIVDVFGKREHLHYTGPQARQLPRLTQELFQWCRSVEGAMHPILVAGILHYEFVSIHPFSDGNGRVTRLLMLLYLRQQGYGFRNVIVPDTYYWEYRKEYYDALNQKPRYREQRVADLTPWLTYFTEGMVTVARSLEHDISVIGTQRQTGDVIRLSQRELRLLDFTRQAGRISLQDVIDILEVPKRTAQRLLQLLTGKTLLRRKGRGRATHYTLIKK